MRKILIYTVLVLIGITGSSVFGDEEIKPLLMHDKGAMSNFLFYRSYVNEKTKLAHLAPEGVLLSKEINGPGLYSVTFAVDESHEKFKYHQQYFIFYFNPVVNDSNDLKLEMKKGSDYLYLVWRKSGQVEFYKHTKDGKNEKLGIWLKPGPDKDNAYQKDTFVTMNIVVPQAGEDLKIYFNKAAAGEADCEFTMPEAPSKGLFGFYNPKWYSSIVVKDIQYKGLQQ